MKRSAVTILMLLGILALCPSPAPADTFAFTPDPADLYDLDHTGFYTWGIDVSALVGMNITEVTLAVDNITNWDDGDNVLFIHLLDNAALGVQSGSDGENFVDQFAGQGPLIAEWHDTNGAATTEDLNYLFSALGLVDSTQVFCGDGVLALGFDPDCRFVNDGITLTITTEVPSPTEHESWGKVKSLFR